MQGKKVGFDSWYNRQYDDYTCVLRLGTVASDLKPNRKKAMIYFERDGNKFLPTAYYATEEHRRTIDQMMSFLGQTNFCQGHMGNQSTHELLKNSGNKRK